MARMTYSPYERFIGKLVGVCLVLVACTTALEWVSIHPWVRRLTVTALFVGWLIWRGVTAYQFRTPRRPAVGDIAGLLFLYACAVDTSPDVVSVDLVTVIGLFVVCAAKRWRKRRAIRRGLEESGWQPEDQPAPGPSVPTNDHLPWSPGGSTPADRDGSKPSALSHADQKRAAAAAARAWADQQDAAANNWEVGGRGEVATAAILDGLPEGWAVLDDLPIPGSNANVDHLAIGPQSLVVLDTKVLPKDLDVRDGQLYRKGQPTAAAMATTCWEARQVEHAAGRAVTGVAWVGQPPSNRPGWADSVPEGEYSGTDEHGNPYRVALVAADHLRDWLVHHDAGGSPNPEPTNQLASRIHAAMNR